MFDIHAPVLFCSRERISIDPVVPSYMDLWYTPETNRDPENGTLKDRFPLYKPVVFRVHVSFVSGVHDVAGSTTKLHISRLLPMSFFTLLHCGSRIPREGTPV